MNQSSTAPRRSTRRIAGLVPVRYTPMCSAQDRLGLADRGFQYVNIDDGWQGTRGSDGRIRPNERFADMQALADSIHGLGLKFGMYTSPGPLTCGEYEGSYGHEAQDVATYCTWGVDLLKYDYCSYRQIAPEGTREQIQAAYRLMGELLRNAERDILFSLCEYGMQRVWEWGREAGGHLWRTTSDIVPIWRSVRTIGFGQHALTSYSGPGGWNDPDMLEVGHVGGWGPPPHPTALTPDEQLTHVGLWCLLGAPLLLGCDLRQMDDWTLALLSNEEVLAVDQDPLGARCRRVRKDSDTQVWARELHDRSVAVGLFNLGPDSATVRVSWEELGLRGPCLARDLWHRSDCGVFDKEYSSSVPSHGMAMLRVRGPDNAPGEGANC
ncbi:MAG: hypothetical protein GF331_19455 [Chitinivibrionales bacterium]|nr:hypothetical protein [Chitinivibrionales bacterium]